MNPARAPHFRIATRHALLAGVVLMLSSAAALALPHNWQLNMREGVTQSAQIAYDIHMLGLWICTAIGVLVFGAMGYAMFKFRRSKGAVAAQFSHNTVAETLWTVIPVLLLIGLAWPSTTGLIALYDTRASEMTVKVTGYQWLWRYEYLGEGINITSRLDRDSNRARQLGSGLNPADVMTGDENTYLLNVDNELVLPTDTKIRFVITADDVIHSWWVPSLGWKQDAVPGVVNEAWTEIGTPGIYRGQCAELCGKDHGFMPIVIRAVPKAEYQSWLAAQKSTADPAARTASAPAPVSAIPAEG